MSDIQKTRRKINPQKFALWIAIGSIIMMFAGLTSGFLVRKPQGDWISYELPWAFYTSTAVVILSSFTMHLAVKLFKKGKQAAHRALIGITLLLGISFTILQYVGFRELLGEMEWMNNISFQFLVIIVLIHAIHIAGGIITMIVFYFRTFSKRFSAFSANGIEIAATYWHFVDILWIYLFIFFMISL